MRELDIGQVTALSGMPPSALRFYEKKGLITAIGRNGLRRQYREDVLITLQLISLGKMAGFTLSEIAAMIGTQGALMLDREKLHAKALEIDKTLRRLKQVSLGLKHVAKCREQDHSQCPEFNKIVSRGLRLAR